MFTSVSMIVALLAFHRISSFEVSSDKLSLKGQTPASHFNLVSSGISSKENLSDESDEKSPESEVRTRRQTNFSNNVCICVTAGSCARADGVSGNDGAGVIDIRIVSMLNPPATTNPTLSVTPVSSGVTPQVTSQSFCQTGLERCCPSTGYLCGIRYPAIAGTKAPAAGQAAYGEYPWQAVILGSGDVFQGSGALIDHLHVVTAAHKVSSFVNNFFQLRVRLGEWDAVAATEPIPAQEFTVSRIFIHPQFTASNLKNNIAIIRLSTAAPLGQFPTITTACLPSNQISNTRCKIAGWGRNDFSSSGVFQSIMRDVEVPLVDINSCQTLLRATRLGANFVLDQTSFMCAGGEVGKDACTGDGGSPLVCQSSGRWYVVGLVAWGIGCGTSNVPGVYVNLANYIGWIQSTTRS